TGGSHVPVIGTSAEKGDGIVMLLDAIDEHWQSLHETDEISSRRARILERRLLKACEEILHERFSSQRGGRVSELVAQMDARETSPYAAAVELLKSMRICGKSVISALAARRRTATLCS